MSTVHAPRRNSSLVQLLYAGLTASALGTLAPLVDLVTVGSIAAHVRDAYPTWPDGSVNADTYAIAGYLSTVGLLGVVGWCWTIRLVRRRSSRSRAVAVTLFSLAALTALTTLSYGGAAYDTVVPTTYGLLGLVPVLVGAGAAVQLYRQPTSPS